MKKILIFSLAYHPHMSGAEEAVKEITDRLPSSEFDFHMITLRFSDTEAAEEKIGTISVHRVGFGPSYLRKILFIPLAALTARSLHKREHFDLFWSLMTYMLFPVLLARLLGTHVPYFLTLQDGDSYAKVFQRWYIRPFTPILDAGFRKAKAIQAISTYLATWPKLRRSDAPVFVIPNGANPRDLSQDVSREEIESARVTLGKKERDVFLINTARLEKQKGNDITIRALALLPKNIKLALVGDGSELSALEHLADETGVRDRVIFTGRVPRSRVSAMRLASDIFVGPSRSEGLGNAFLSAMASRIPVVATQVGGLADYIFNEGDSKTAWAVASDSPDAIAKAVKNILENPGQVIEVTERARKMVEEKYSWDKVAIAMHSKIFS